MATPFLLCMGSDVTLSLPTATMLMDDDDRPKYLSSSSCLRSTAFVIGYSFFSVSSRNLVTSTEHFSNVSMIHFPRNCTCCCATGLALYGRLAHQFHSLNPLISATALLTRVSIDLYAAAINYGATRWQFLVPPLWVHMQTTHSLSL